MSLASRASILLVVVAVHTPVFAQSPSQVQFTSPIQDVPGWTNLAATVTPTDDLTVVLNDGTKRKGRAAVFTTDQLSLVQGGPPIQIDRSDVREIRKRGDSLQNGLLIGLLAGAGAGIYLSSVTRSLCEWDCPEANMSFLMGLGGGVGVGLLVDALRHGTTSIYRRKPQLAIAPSVGRRSVGVQAQVSLPFRP
jgi:hypothetical protein